MARYALGVDIGGTKVSVTLGTSRGKILAQRLIPTLTGRKARQGIQKLTLTLQELSRKVPRRSLAGIGVGIPGPIDPQRGIVERSPHLGGWEGFPLKSYLQRKLGLPLSITNDANAAAVGEKVFGEARRSRTFIYLTVSTGIGGGIFIDGRLHMGASFGAGEVGHVIVVPKGEKCGCGNRGCLEAYASGTAIARFFKTRKGKMLRGMPRGILEGKSITADWIAQAAQKGNPLAREAYHRAGLYLGIGLANLINLLNPELILLGGSVMKSSRLLWRPMMKSVRSHAWPVLLKGCRIQKASLGEHVGDLGALALAFAPEAITR